MRILSSILIVGGLLVMPVSAQADSCMDKAETQLDLDHCAGASFNQADQELNDIYKKIISDYADDPKFIENLKESQRAWLKFRDAEMKALFPHHDEDLYYGSAFPMCSNTWLETLTRERISQLSRWTRKAKEGDACSGSIKVEE